MQHGTLPLSGDIARICDALVYPDESARAQARTQVRAHAATLADALGVTLDWQTAADAFVAGFVEAFDVTFAESELSAAERADADRLTAEVYASDDWTFRR